MYPAQRRGLRLGRFVLALLTLLPLLTQAATPNVKLQDLTGSWRHVSEYIGKGRWVIVAVWSSDCSICERDIPHMIRLHEQSPHALVLGLSVDGPAKRDEVQAFVNRQGLSFPNLLGLPGDATRLSGHTFVGTPTYYFFAPDGRFATQRIGSLTQTQAESVLDALNKAR